MILLIRRKHCNILSVGLKYFTEIMQNVFISNRKEVYMKNNKRRIVSIAIVTILVLAMVVPVVVSALITVRG